LYWLMDLFNKLNSVVLTKSAFNEKLMAVTKDQEYPAKVMDILEFSNDIERLYADCFDYMNANKDRLEALSFSGVHSDFKPTDTIQIFLEGVKVHINRSVSFAIVEDLKKTKDFLSMIQMGSGTPGDGQSTPPAGPASFNDDFIEDFSLLMGKMDQLSQDTKGIEDRDSLKAEFQALKDDYVVRFKDLFLAQCKQYLNIRIQRTDDWNTLCNSVIGKLDFKQWSDQFTRLQRSLERFLDLVDGATLAEKSKKVIDAYAQYPEFVNTLRFVANNSDKNLVDEDPEGKHGELFQLKNCLSDFIDARDEDFIQIYRGLGGDKELTHARGQSAAKVFELSEKWGVVDLRYIHLQVNDIIDKAKKITSAKSGEYFTKEVDGFKHYAGLYPLRGVIDEVMGQPTADDEGSRVRYLNKKSKDSLEKVVTGIHDKFAAVSGLKEIDEKKWENIKRLKHFMDHWQEGYSVQVEMRDIKNLSDRWDLKLTGLSMYIKGDDSEAGQAGGSRIYYRNQEIENYFIWKPMEVNRFMIYLEAGSQMLCLGKEQVALEINTNASELSKRKERHVFDDGKYHEEHWPFLRFLSKYKYFKEEYYKAKDKEEAGEDLFTANYRFEESDNPEEKGFIKKCEITIEGELESKTEATEMTLVFTFDPAFPLYIEPVSISKDSEN